MYLNSYFHKFNPGIERDENFLNRFCLEYENGRKWFLEKCQVPMRTDTNVLKNKSFRIYKNFSVWRDR